MYIFNKSDTETLTFTAPIDYRSILAVNINRVVFDGLSLKVCPSCIHDDDDDDDDDLGRVLVREGTGLGSALMAPFLL